MRILQLHSNFIEYKPIEKEIEIAEPTEKKPKKFEEIVVLFTSVEEGDNESVAEKAIEEVKNSLQTLKVNRILIYPYAHLSSILAKPTTALQILKKMEEYAKKKGIETYRTPFGWCKQFSLSIKGHPLAEQSKIFSPIEIEKKKNEKPRWKTPKPEYLIFTRDGKTVDPEKYHFKKNEENLKVLVDKEVFKKESVGGEPRIIDILKRFGFEWEPSSDSGHMRYGPKAALIMDLVGDYAWQSVNEIGIPSFLIKGTNLFNLENPAIKEHVNLFGERLYTVKVDKKEYVLKYAACFQQFSMVKDWLISYKQIPFGMFEIADSYRLEQSGECLLGFRLRRFYMPDYHIFCRNLEHAKEMTLKVHKKIHEKIREVGNKYVSLYNLTKSFFDKNKGFLKEMVANESNPVLLHFVPEKKYYWVINVEYHIVDELKRSREIATVQIDIGNAKRFGIRYVTEKGAEDYPPILHIALLGGIERYIFTVFDTALKQKIPILPLWLSPTQVRIIPVSDRFLKEAVRLAKKIEKQCIRVDVDDRPLTMQKKIREAEIEWIPYILVIGQKEIESGILAVRERKTGKIINLQIKDFVNNVRKEIVDKPFRHSTLPMLLSQRPQF